MLIKKKKKINKLREEKRREDKQKKEVTIKVNYVQGQFRDEMLIWLVRL